jgi:hypothetical protein
MRKKDLIEQKLNEIVENHNNYEFPQFLQALRMAYDTPRRNVCKELSFSEMRLFCLEHGVFRKNIREEEANILGEYYGVDPSIIRKKANLFIYNNKGISQQTYCPRGY